MAQVARVGDRKAPLDEEALRELQEGLLRAVLLGRPLPGKEQPLSAGDFVRAENDLQQLLDGIAADSGSKLEHREDTFGYTWIVVRDAQLEDQVATVHAVAQGLEEQGFGPQLLAAVFKFEGGKHPVYWIYGYKRGAFWPFVPMGEGQERDNAEELELKAKLEPELPVEQDLSRWFGVFDSPL